MPGRTFASRPTSTPSSPTGWRGRTRRVVRTIKARPIDLVDADRAAMLALPPVPLHLGWRNQIRLGRDYYVRVDTNDYSVDPTAIGRLVDVTADLDRVRVRARRAARRRPRPGLGPRHDGHRPRPRADRRRAARAVPAAPPGARRRMTWSVTWPTTTAPSGSTDGEVADGRQDRHRRGQADPLPRRRVEGTPDHRGRRPARRPGPRRRLDPRGLPRRRPRTRSLGPQRLRRPATHPRRRVPGPQDPRRLRLGPPTRRPSTGRRARLRGVPDRSPQRRAARPTRHRQDPPRHRARHHRRPPRPPGPVRHRHRLGHPPHRRPPRSAGCPASSPGCAATG